MININFLSSNYDRYSRISGYVQRESSLVELISMYVYSRHALDEDIPAALDYNSGNLYENESAKRIEGFVSGIGRLIKLVIICLLT